ncbi:uncharacterized protein [Anoplolepis gracilipes]|uniref:uncharacterized protein n=1 Tax=Anoplolepis gracilipes TaxID=354296 RepID=UPI003BA21961
MDQLALTHSLNLSQRDSVQMLMSGINSQALRALAASLRVETVDQFLDEMHRITAVTAKPEGRRAIAVKSSGSGHHQHHQQRCDSCGKPGHAKKNYRRPKFPCAYCKELGHYRFSCPKLMERKQQHSTVVPAVAAAVSAVHPSQGPTETVAVVQQDSGHPWP